MRAALYARVSSEEQVEGYSIDAQRRAFETLCQGRDWIPYHEYIEEGKSARTENINKRPEFKEMIGDAIAEKFDVLVVHKLDRFSRNLKVTIEYFDILLKSAVTFVSISEQMDFTTPSGKVHLALLGAFAQYYSDNLSQETKKGWHERRNQGLYCGTLPFGAVKGKDGIPISDIQERNIRVDEHELSMCNYEGLKMAFTLSASGKSDKEIAIALNKSGYKTTGTHGPRPFAKDTVKDILKNKFYIGYIPDGQRGWLKAKHDPFIELDLFNEVQKMRASRIGQRPTVRSDARLYSLSGITRCSTCGSTLRVFKGRGRARLVCNGRIKGDGCTESSTCLDIYEQQLVAYLGAFHIPDDYQEKILEAQKKLESVYDKEEQRNLLKTRLERLKELYGWGHKSKTEYLADYAVIERELRQLPSIENDDDTLPKLALFLKNIVKAWEQATQEQRNRLLKCLFEAIWIKDKRVSAVTPRPEFKPFFELQYADMSQYVLQKRPRGDLNP